MGFFKIFENKKIQKDNEKTSVDSSLRHNCFNHPDKKTNVHCKWCGRYLCESCYLLVGKHNRKDSFFKCKNNDDCLEYQSKDPFDAEKTQKRIETEKSKTYYCRMCGRKNATEHDVGPMKFYVCSQNCANLLYNSVISKALGGFRNVMVHGNANNFRDQINKHASISYFCNLCGSKMGIDTTGNCPKCGGVQLIR